MTLRDELLARLASQPFDLLVIGGGIVGAGIARDAAMRGLKVALVEQEDFGSGTSSKTSKLIHGGLRYLEHGRLRLVCQSLRERRTLRTIAPEFVRPLSLLLPVFEGDPRPAWKIGAGLWLYDLLALGGGMPPHRMLSARGAVALEPGLRADQLRAAGCYTDCQMDDARLCLANILQAVRFGAVCCNYVRLSRLLRGRAGVCGGAVEEALTGRDMEIQARVVVNATGPWSDGLRRLSDRAARARLAPTKGIHLILPRIARQGLFVQAKRDGRMIFLLPWGDHSLVGTTESPVDNSPGLLSATADEVGYLLDEVNRVIPGHRVGEEDVISTFAGARPLLAGVGAAPGASREHRIEIDRWGMISVLGGKYTTYRLIAQQVVDHVARSRRSGEEPCLTADVSLMETAHGALLEPWRDVIRAVDPALMDRLLARYGVGVASILRRADQEPALLQPVCPHHPHIQAELVHAMQQELACTVTDVLARRTRIAWSPCQGLDALSTLAEMFRRYHGLTRDQVEAQLREYHQFLARSLAFRSADGALREAAAVDRNHSGGDRRARRRVTGDASDGARAKRGPPTADARDL